ncbi:MAG TPA: hypothetical protein VEJ19_02895 [Nitrososphaerales archaeon]|nr:hypothetical protein [Nitrososphaerales archaeon]
MNVKLTKEQIASVFSFHPSLRFVTVVAKDGTLLDSVKRAGLDSLEPPEETRRILERWSIARSMTSGSDEFFGRMKTIIVRREKLVEMLFPSSDYMVIISAHPSFPLEKTAKLESLLSKF